MTPEELAEARRLSQEVVDAGQVPKPAEPMCSEQRVWELGHRIGLVVCACGQAGYLVHEAHIRDDSESRVERMVKHSYYIPPAFFFDSEATAFVGDTFLGPGLTRSYERTDERTCLSVNGHLKSASREVKTLGMD